MATQAERTAVTRTKLLDATAACLAELGYANTSTTEIAKRAGVSRGAQLHHFPTRAELVAAAVDHILERRVEEFRALIATIPEGSERIEPAIDLLWAMFKGPTFAAWSELATAARTDPELRERVVRVSDDMSVRVQEAFRDLFEPPPGQVAAPLFYEVAPSFLFATLEGLAMQHMAGSSIAGEDDDGEQVIQVLKYIANALPIFSPDTDEDPT